MQLWDAIVAYDFETPLEDLIGLRQQYGAQLQLADYFFTSGGTSREPRTFPFGPNSEFWINSLEDHVKYRQQTLFVALNMPMFQLAKSFSMEEHDPIGTIPHKYFISAQLDQPGAIAYLIYQLEQIGKCTLFAHPNCWLYLLSDPMFRYYLSHSQISAMSTNWEAFFAHQPKRLHFNDNMVNWTTTMNFYTCEHGTKHFLPTFIPTTNGIVSLINICQRPIMPVDDLMILADDVEQCQCGRKFRKIQTFIPHIENTIRAKDGTIVYDLGLADRLQAKYLNLQFIQTSDDVVHVLYVCDGEPDIDILTNFFATYGLSVRFLPSTFSLQRNKLPVFWRPNRKIYYCTWPPSMTPDFIEL